MSVKAIKAEVYIQSGVEAEVQIGREIIKTIYEEPVLEPLSVTENGVYTAEGDGFNPVTVNVEAPKDPNVVEGEFTVTETGVLTIDTGYDGDSYPRMFNIYPADGIVDINAFNAPKYAINTMSGIKITVTEPSYPNANTGAENQMRVAYVYKSSNVGFSSSSVSSYVFTKASNDGVLGVAAAVKMSDNRHMRLYVADNGETTFLSTGIRYKYQVFY